MNNIIIITQVSDIRKKFLPVGLMRHRVPREAQELPGFAKNPKM